MRVTKEETQASQSYRDQMRRCYNPKSKLFKYYGLKGITVDYSKENYVKWWKDNLKSFKGKTPTAGRIDHSKGYCFENIVMEDNSTNFKEMIVRTQIALNNKINFGSKVYVYSKDGSEHVATIDTVRDAARLFGIERRTVQYQMRGHHKKTVAINFILKNEERHNNG